MQGITQPGTETILGKHGSEVQSFESRKKPQQYEDPKAWETWPPD